MQAILKFNLPEDNVEYLTTVKAANLASIIFDFDQWLRDYHKYDVPIGDAEIVRNKLREIMADYDLSFDSSIFA